jgi:hypothetical protein
MRHAVLFGLLMVFGGVGCRESYDPFRPNQIERALEAGARVESELLMSRLEEIVNARLTDPEREMSWSGTCEPGGDCVYSRRATEQLLRRWASEEDFPLPLDDQRVTDDGFTTTNLWLEFPGVTHPDEIVLTTAHYDAWYGAANDNGSGTAVLLEAARALAGLDLDRTVRVLWVDGEEIGMVGTGRYLAEHGADNVVMVVNADMVSHRGTQSNPLTSEPDSVEFWIQANEPSAGAAFKMSDLAGKMPEPVGAKAVVYPGSGLSVVGVTLGYSMSDHAPFWLRGIPALFPFPTGDIPAWYHTPADTLDEVDVGRFERMGRLWAGTLAAFATEER